VRGAGPWGERTDPPGLTPLQLYLLDLNGFLLIERALDESTVDRLRAAIDRQRLPPPDHDLGRQRFGQEGRMFEWDGAFADLIDHPWSVAVLKAVMGRYVRLDHAYGIVMAPGTAGLGLHGPVAPFDPAQFYLVAHGHPRSGLLVCSFSLSDGRPGSGGFGCIPGSHRAGLPLPPEAESLVVEVPQPAGSLLVFTEALVHCTIPWQGPGTRLAVLLKYSPGNSAWDPSPAAPERTVASMSESRRRFFQAPSVGGRVPTFDD
jgi:hypothetical protein